MSRATILFGVALVAFAAGCTRDRPPASQSSPAGDVLLIVVDTLRADHLHLYGYARQTSPHLDRLARDSVIYENAISAGTWTPPAHGSLFTGRWPSFHGIERVPGGDGRLAQALDPSIQTLAETLRAHGFHTTAFVANWAYLTRALGFARGFDEWVDEGVQRADRLRKVVEAWLPKQKSRLFVFMNVLDPHEPYAAPPPFDTRFPGKRPEYGDTLHKDLLERRALPDDMLAHFVSQYDGEIAFADEALGRIFAALDRTGRYDDALLIVTADHGDLLGEHGLAGHGQLPYEGLVRVPLIVKHPRGWRGGERVERRVSTMGIYATILATVGIPLPVGVQARPLDEPHPVWIEDVHWDQGRVRAGYAGRYKIVSATPAQGPTTWLYDLEADPHEEHALPPGPDTERLSAALADFSGEARPVFSAERPVVDPEQQVRLRMLGYVQ